jgi:hypothetical protein
VSNRPSSLPRVFLPRSSQSSTLLPNAGVWTPLTISGIDLTPTIDDDNFGLQDVVADPSDPGRLRGHVCYQGIYGSDDHGDSWRKVSEPGGWWDQGKCGAIDYTCTGHLLLGSSTNNFTDIDGKSCQLCVLRSDDHGETWTASAQLNGSSSTYGLSAHPSDPERLIACSSSGAVYECLNLSTGFTFTLVRAAGGGDGHCIQWIDGTRFILVGQDTGDTEVWTWSGSSWSSTQIAALDGLGHTHGTYRGWYDQTGGYYYHPTGESGGIWRAHSSTGFLTFSQVYSASNESVVVGTSTMLYAMGAGPLQSTADPTDPKYTTATRSSGTDWGAPVNLSATVGMHNGPKRMAVYFTGTQWVIVSFNWARGAWRYVEPLA